MPTGTPVNAPEETMTIQFLRVALNTREMTGRTASGPITVEMMWGAPKGGQGGRLFTQTLLKRVDASSVPEESRFCQWQWQARHPKSS